MRFSEHNAKLLILLIFVMIHNPHFDVASVFIRRYSTTA